MNKIIGIIGSGQLGRLLIEYGIKKLLNTSYSIKVLSNSIESSIKELNDPLIEIIIGDYNDKNDIINFAKKCDIITYEIEYVNVEALEEVLNKYPNKNIIPKPSVLATIQDKYYQKIHYKNNLIPFVEYELFNYDDYNSYLNDETIVIKSRLGGYDGRGVYIGKPNRDVFNCFYVEQPNIVIEKDNKDNKDNKNSVIIEKYIDKKQEISVIVAIGHNKEIVNYEPILMTFHKEQHTLNTCEPPILLDKSVIIECQEIAKKTAISFGSPGLYAIEMFLEFEQSNDFNKGYKIYVNETAPRVHNSGHHTINTTDISQFEMLARIILNYPLNNPQQIHKNYIMRNLYPKPLEKNKVVNCSLINHIAVLDNNKYKGPFLIDYGKKTIKNWRKMGHITHIGNSYNDVLKEMDFYRLNNIIEYLPESELLDIKIGIIMGSMSDWDIMKEACLLLRSFNIGYEATIVSAHRTPDRLMEYAKTANNRGLKVIIAGAGGAAHLPGMIAANTFLPVIGIPIKTSTLNGIDSLYSIVQMPYGVPVACMAINGAKNGALLALQILGKYDIIERQRNEAEKMVIESAYLRYKE